MGFSLSVYQPNQLLLMGTSDDYGVCKGKKDGIACTTVINRFVIKKFQLPCLLAHDMIE